MNVVYFSSKSLTFNGVSVISSGILCAANPVFSMNRWVFSEKTGLAAQRIPLEMTDTPLKVSEPFVLVTPTFADGEGNGAVPKQVIRFLNDAENRALLRGVIAGGNRNFGQYYACAGDVIAARCKVPCLYKFELMGTPEDVEKVKNGVSKL